MAILDYRFALIVLALGSISLYSSKYLATKIEEKSKDLLKQRVNKMPNGYDTILKDDGNSLSGGEKQRLALARALVNNSEILILDEVTSAPDSDSKKMLLETIQNLKKDHTILFITHDKEIEKIADKIIYL